MDPPPTEPIYVLGTRQALLGLVDQAEVQDLGLHNDSVRLACTEMLHWQRPNHEQFPATHRDEQPWLIEHKSREVVDELCQIMNLHSFTAANARHTCVAKAAIIIHRDGWKLVLVCHFPCVCLNTECTVIRYSGDTIPSDDIIRAGEGATLLIHEATMADEEWELARFKMHSTIGEAINVGRR